MKECDDAQDCWKKKANVIIFVTAEMMKSN